MRELRGAKAGSASRASASCASLRFDGRRSTYSGDRVMPVYRYAMEAIAAEKTSTMSRIPWLAASASTFANAACAQAPVPGDAPWINRVAKSGMPGEGQ